jgi:hypothetical protein
MVFNNKTVDGAQKHAAAGQPCRRCIKPKGEEKESEGRNDDAKVDKVKDALDFSCRKCSLHSRYDWGMLEYVYD